MRLADMAYREGEQEAGLGWLGEAAKAHPGGADATTFLLRCVVGGVCLCVYVGLALW